MYDHLSDFYDELTDEAEYEKRLGFIVFLLQKHGIDRGIILDLACGTGRLTAMLGKLGYEMIGVDVSVQMLEKAMEKKLEYDLDAVFIRQKMQETIL